MKSSFKKKQKTVSKGVFGHPDLDSIMQRSLCRGQLIIIEQDHPTTQYLALQRYFLSSNYNENLSSIVFDTIPNRWQHMLSPPLLKTSIKVQSKQSQIAWRYDSMSLKQVNAEQHQGHYDLRKQIPNPNPTLLLTRPYTSASLHHLYLEVEKALLASQLHQQDATTKKLLFASLPSVVYCSEQFSSWVQAVRCLTRSSNLVTVISIPPIAGEYALRLLRVYGDCYLKLGAVSKEYGEFNGSIQIVKEYSSCTVRSVLRGSTLWGCKLTSKQMQIQALYEQPDFKEQTKELM